MQLKKTNLCYLNLLQATSPSQDPEVTAAMYLEDEGQKGRV